MYVCMYVPSKSKPIVKHICVCESVECVCVFAILHTHLYIKEVWAYMRVYTCIHHHAIKSMHVTLMHISVH